jgi:ATP-dependent Clp protease protease subunit
MATLKIYNPIMREEEKEMYYWMTGAEGVCFKDVDSFISSIPEEDSKIELRLHCVGGSVSEGWAIVDKLRATGKVISAVIEGDCASMASVILLAASERKAYPHATLLIHHPYIPEYTLADAYNANDLQKLADELKAESDKVLDFYVERTGADREALLAKMDADKAFGMEEAKELGFIHDIIVPASASARGWGFKQLNTFNMNTKDKARKVLQDLGELLGLKAEAPIVEAYELTTESGDVLTINKTEGDPEVGDSASPDGEHLMPDGTTIVVVDGVITEIRPKEEEEETPAEPNPVEEQLAQANERIAELEAQLAQAHAETMSAEDKEIIALVNRAGGKAWLATVSSDHQPAKREVTVDGDVKKRVSRVSARLEELRKKQSN